MESLWARVDHTRLTSARRKGGAPRGRQPACSPRFVQCKRRHRPKPLPDPIFRHEPDFHWRVHASATPISSTCNRRLVQCPASHNAQAPQPLGRGRAGARRRATAPQSGCRGWAPVGDPSLTSSRRQQRQRRNLLCLRSGPLRARPRRCRTHRALQGHLHRPPLVQTPCHSQRT